MEKPLTTRRVHPTPELPRFDAPFYGRESELAEIDARLNDPGCRMLTIVGVGGVGKTRLAVQVAERQTGCPGRVVFVPLEGVGSAAQVWAALQTALGLKLPGESDLRAELLAYLAQAETLLILDNIEAERAVSALLVDLLAHAPGLKLLVTARQVLHVGAEWVYPLGGLAYPACGETGSGDYPAVQLFAGRAQRMRPDFSLEDEAPAVVEICALVDGMPLALEMAAGWVRLMNCAAIAAELRAGLQLLATPLQDIPSRQRSLQVICEQTWDMLGAQRQNVFARLAVFRDGFDLPAAIQVGKASLAVLSSLVDAAILRLEASGRYRLHSLLRQYAYEKLALSPEAQEAADQHASYYLEFLRARLTAIQSADPVVFAELKLELENLRSAWELRLTHVNIEELHASLEAYVSFQEQSGRYQELLGTLEKTIRAVKAQPQSEETRFLLALLYSHSGYMAIRVGRFGESRAAFEHSQAILDGLGCPPESGFGSDPRVGLAFLENVLGQYENAVELGEAARRRAAQRADSGNLQIALYTLANAYFACGDTAAAEAAAREVRALCEASGLRWFLGYILILLGQLALAQADYSAARTYFQASLDLKNEQDDPEGIALALTHLGQVQLRQGDDPVQPRRRSDQALADYRRAEEIYARLGDRGGQARAVFGLAQAALRREEWAEAAHDLRRALQTAVQIRWAPMILRILGGAAELLWAQGENGRALELLATVSRHPAAEQSTRAEAARRLEQLEGYAPGGQIEELNYASEAGLFRLAQDLLAEARFWQALAITAPSPQQTTAMTGGSQPNGLVEQLTERELDVLELMAEGLTNPQIAARLVIAVGTVKSYTAQIYGKLNVSNRTQAAARARELGLLG